MSLYKKRNCTNSFYAFKNINRGAFGALKQIDKVKDVLKAKMFGKVTISN